MQRVKACSGPVCSVACPGPDQKRKKRGQHKARSKARARPAQGQRAAARSRCPPRASTRPEGARQGRARSAPLPMSSWRLWPTKSKPNGTCLGGPAALFQEAPQGVATRWRQIAHHCYDWKQRRKYKRDMCSQVAQVAAANFTQGKEGKELKLKSVLLWHFWKMAVTRQHCSKNQVHSFVPLHPVSLTLQPRPQGPHR